MKKLLDLINKEAAKTPSISLRTINDGNFIGRKSLLFCQFGDCSRHMNNYDGTINEEKYGNKWLQLEYFVTKKV